MDGERLYEVRLSWDEIDTAMTALRAQVFHYEDECATAAPSLAAELDQCIAGWWELIHRLGDARRGPHGEPLVLAARAVQS